MRIDPVLTFFYAKSTRCSCFSPDLISSLFVTEEGELYFKSDHIGGYFHFLLELAPILLFAKSSGFKIFCISSKLLRNEQYLISALEHFNITFRIEADGDGCGAPLRPFDSVFDESLVCDSAYVYPNSLELDWLNSGFSRKPLSQTNLKILISRPKTKRGRSIANASQVFDFMIGNGFRIVQLEDLEVSEQVEIFRSASIVVGVHGAGLSNIAWMPLGGIVIEIMPKIEVKWHFAAMCKMIGLEHKILLAESGGTVLGGRPDEVYVPVHKLAKLL